MVANNYDPTLIRLFSRLIKIKRFGRLKSLKIEFVYKIKIELELCIIMDKMVTTAIQIMATLTFRFTQVVIDDLVLAELVSFMSKPHEFE